MAILKEAYVAKSRQNNRLSNRELTTITKTLEEQLGSLLASIPSENEGVSGEPSWYGLDKGNEIEIEGESREEVVKAWAEALEVDMDKLLSTQVGNGMFFFAHPAGPANTQEIWVVTKDHKEEVLAA